MTTPVSAPPIHPSTHTHHQPFLEGDYYDLSLIPERYTGYSGADAQRVWKTIYEENCFGLSEANLVSSKPGPAAVVPDTLASDGADQCLEKRVYYKIVSGLHASISTHICMEHLNQTTGEWVCLPTCSRT